jgi:molybdopterin molybdotransferase
MLSVEEALSRVRAAFAPLPAETVSIADALGRVLAADAVSRVTQPPHDVSAMDGYAVRAADVATAPVTLDVVARIPAGSSFDGEIQSGQAARIFTGAPLPAGADSIVIQEDTEETAGRVTVRASAPAGTYVRPAGLDFRKGDVGLPAGQRLGARDIGFAAAMNLPWLAVRRRPRVAILATGDEVVMPGDPKGPNQIISSNGLSLAAFVTACGGQAINLGIAPDNRDSLAAIAEGAAGADLLITSGGASVGDHDLVRAGLGDSGLEVDFWKIAMRPGKPLIFGRIGTTPMLGLPGNPVSSLICAVVFVRTALDALLGLKEDALALESVILGADLPANDRRQDYLRAKLSLDGQGRRVATAFGRQDSSMLATLARADCLIVRKPHAEALNSGDPVDILPLAGNFPGI